MRLAVSTLLTLFALPVLTATTQTAQRANVQARAASHGSCPVGLMAQRRNDGQTMWVVSLQDETRPNHATAPKPGSSGVHISLTPSENSPIRQAELAVYFIPPATRVLPVHTPNGSQYPSKPDKAPAEQKKTFHVSASDDTSQRLTADLLVGPASGISRIHILSMEYADGTTWTAPSNSECTVEPNGLLLVGTH